MFNIDGQPSYNKGARFMPIYRGSKIVSVSSDNSQPPSSGPYIHPETNPTTTTSAQKLVEITTTVFVPALGSLDLSLDTGFNSYELRTLRANVESANANIVIHVLDKASGSISEYESIESTNIYDIINLPIIDRDGTKKIHLRIINKSVNNTANVDLVMRITNLIQ